jgi:hypothetical protein
MLTDFFARGVKVGYPQKTVVRQGNSEMDSRDRCISAEIMYSLFKHSSQDLEEEVSSIATRSFLALREDSLTDFLNVSLDVFQTKNVACNLLGTVILSRKAEL